MKSQRVSNLVYRVVVGLVGAAIVIGGLILVPFPGPGWLIVIIGLAVLASEFAWARRLLDLVRARVEEWTRWIKRQGWTVRLLVALGTALCVAGALYATALIFGVPSWVPGWVVQPLPGL